MEYLHTDCTERILHRDIKSSNVMLDADFNAHLGDFGLGRLMNHQKKEKTTMAAGTIGYMAPQALYNGKATKESDVFSFGIKLVLEVVCGRRPLDLNAHELDVRAVKFEDHVLLNSIWRAHEKGTYLNVADPEMLQTCSHPSRMAHAEAAEVRTAIQVPEEKMVENLLRVGLLCSLPNPKARPTMEQVIRMLKQMGNIDGEDCATTKVSMPPLPTTNPVERRTR